MADFSFDTTKTANDSRTPNDKRGDVKNLLVDINQASAAQVDNIESSAAKLQVLNDQAFTIAEDAREVKGRSQDAIDELTTETMGLFEKYQEADNSMFHDLIANFTGGKTTDDYLSEIRGQQTKARQISTRNRKSLENLQTQAFGVQKEIAAINIVKKSGQEAQSVRASTLSKQQEAINAENAAVDQRGDNFTLRDLQQMQQNLQQNGVESKVFNGGQLENQIIRKLKARDFLKLTAGGSSAKKGDAIIQEEKVQKAALSLLSNENANYLEAQKIVALNNQQAGKPAGAFLITPNLRTNTFIPLSTIEEALVIANEREAKRSERDPRFRIANNNLALAFDDTVSLINRASEGAFQPESKDGQINLQSVPPAQRKDFTEVNNLQIASETALYEGNINKHLSLQAAKVKKLEDINTQVIKARVDLKSEPQQPAFKEYLANRGVVGDTNNARAALISFAKQPASANLAMPREIQAVMNVLQSQWLQFSDNRLDLIPKRETTAAGTLSLKDLTKQAEEEFFDTVFSKRFIRTEDGDIQQAKPDTPKGESKSLANIMLSAYAVEYNKFVMQKLIREQPDVYAPLLNEFKQPRQEVFKSTNALLSALMLLDVKALKQGTLQNLGSVVADFKLEAENADNWNAYKETNFSLGNSFPSALLDSVMFANNGDRNLRGYYLNDLRNQRPEDIAQKLAADMANRSTNFVGNTIAFGKELGGNIADAASSLEVTDLLQPLPTYIDILTGVVEGSTRTEPVIDPGITNKDFRTLGQPQRQGQ